MLKELCLTKRQENENVQQYANRPEYLGCFVLQFCIENEVKRALQELVELLKALAIVLRSGELHRLLNAITEEHFLTTHIRIILKKFSS
jgi:hypothetical protein